MSARVPPFLTPMIIICGSCLEVPFGWLVVPLSAGDEVGGKGGPPSSTTGLEGIGGDCIANSSSPKSKAAMREVLTLEDFSLAKAGKLYPTLKEQLPEDEGPNEEKAKESASSSPTTAGTARGEKQL